MSAGPRPWGGCTFAQKQKATKVKMENVNTSPSMPITYVCSSSSEIVGASKYMSVTEAVEGVMLEEDGTDTELYVGSPATTAAIPWLRVLLVTPDE